MARQIHQWPTEEKKKQKMGESGGRAHIKCILTENEAI